jgi:hypothetical protein
VADVPRILGISINIVAADERQPIFAMASSAPAWPRGRQLEADRDEADRDNGARSIHMKESAGIPNQTHAG